jgi:hypothetical protein
MNAKFNENLHHGLKRIVRCFEKMGQNLSYV